jgi:prephenate dehydrogenase
VVEPSTPAAGAEAVGRLPARIAFLGFGLIGGSIAAALRSAVGRGAHLTAWTPTGSGPAEGLRRGLLDERAHDPDAAIEAAELIVLAGPPMAILEALGRHGDGLRAAAAGGATITDVGSTKHRIVEAASAARLPFVGGHPMAGRETTGVASASAELFVDRPWVIVRGDAARDVDVERVEALARATGARPIRLGAEEHDAAVAAISHLPLVVAAALVEAVGRAGGRGVKAADWPLARSLAATGWSDMTRLAKGDPEMGAGILATNSTAVAERLRSLRLVLDAWIERLERDAPAAQLRDQLDVVRRSLVGEETE